MSSSNPPSSGKTGHKQEFVICHETRRPLLLDEAERCEITGYFVRIGILERCEVSGKRVLPIGLERCAISGKRALKRFLGEQQSFGYPNLGRDCD
jgi:hypothetical protein